MSDDPLAYDAEWVRKNPAAARLGLRSQAWEDWLWSHPDYESDTPEEYTAQRAAGLRPLDGKPHTPSTSEGTTKE